MMTPIQQAKKTLRAELRQRLRSLDSQIIHVRSQHAAAKLCECPAFARAQTLMIFLPIPHEIDATPIALRAWQEQKTVTVPLVSYEQKHLIPVEVRSLDEPMHTDHYGLSTPLHGSPIPVEMIDLVVVPGLGFDHHGHRVGRGGGFYDRFLAQPGFRGVTCGYAFDEQLVDHVPTTEHDVPLHMLVTDRQLLVFDRHGR